MTHHSPDLEETPARQGATGTGLRWVLRISLALVVIAFLAIWVVFAHHGNGPGGQTSAGQSVATAQSTARQPQTSGG